MAGDLRSSLKTSSAQEEKQFVTMHDDICLTHSGTYFAMYTNIESLYCKPETNIQSALCIHRISIYGFNQLRPENSLKKKKRNQERKKERKEKNPESSKKAKLECAVHQGFPGG